jgi:hypothetical protein
MGPVEEEGLATSQNFRLLRLCAGNRRRLDSQAADRFTEEPASTGLSIHSCRHGLGTVDSYDNTQEDFEDETNTNFSAIATFWLYSDRTAGCDCDY